MIHDPEDVITVISSEGIQKGVLVGNTIHIVEQHPEPSPTSPKSRQAVRLPGSADGESGVSPSSLRSDHGE